MEPGADSIPTTLLTGFLGSGKTTLLNALLAHPALADTAVLINEFGDVGIDHLLVENLDDDVVLLNAGCLCCTIRDDLVVALRTLHERRGRREVPAFNRVMVETTGLADPAPIVHTLLSHEALRDDYHVGGIVTTVDAVNAERQLDRHVECVRQAVIADRLVITKSDLCSANDVERVGERLRRLNPGAPILRAVNGELSPDLLLGTGRFDLGSHPPEVAAWLDEVVAANAHAGGDVHDPNRHGARIRSIVLQAERPVGVHHFVAWLEKQLVTHGENLLRVKGLLNALGSERPLLVNGVQTVFHPLVALPAWPDESRHSRLVVIGQDLDETAVIESFHREVSNKDTLD